MSRCKTLLHLPIIGLSCVMAACGGANQPQLDYEAAAEYSARYDGVSLLVMQGGEIIFEDYPNGGGPEIAWITASGTKSFWGVLLAAMVQDGIASIDEPVSDTITEWRDDARKSRITVAQLLSMTDGLAGQGSGPGPVDTYAEAVALPSVNEPGEVFHYRPAPWQVFGEWVRRKMAPEYPDAVAYLQARLLNNLGVAPASWPLEADGYPRMPSSSQWTAREWAVFGEFARLGGQWGGQQLVDPDAFRASITGVPANPGYGLGWWLAAEFDESVDPGKNSRDFLAWLANHPEIPEGAYMARGFSDLELFRHLLGEAGAP